MIYATSPAENGRPEIQWTHVQRENDGQCSVDVLHGESADGQLWVGEQYVEDIPNNIKNICNA